MPLAIHLWPLKTGSLTTTLDLCCVIMHLYYYIVSYAIIVRYDALVLVFPPLSPLAIKVTIQVLVFVLVPVFMQ